MSYAVIQTGGKQYKVKSGEILKVEKLPDFKPDSKIEFKDILAYGDDKIIEIGTPLVQGSKVEANLITINMSYAVIQTGGKQYKVKSGEILKIEKLIDSKSKNKIEFNEILAYGDDKIIEIGSPTVTGAKVEAELIKNAKNRTVIIFKKRRRHNSRRKNGHRQEYSMIRINKIFSKDGKILSEAEKVSKVTKKTETKKEASK